MRCLTCRIRHKLSIKHIICIKLERAKCFRICLTFDISGVECDVKRFHIAFDTPKTPFYLPIPENFPLSYLVVFDFSPDLLNLVEFQQTLCGTLALGKDNLGYFHAKIQKMIFCNFVLIQIQTFYIHWHYR